MHSLQVGQHGVDDAAIQASACACMLTYHHLPRKVIIMALGLPRATNELRNHQKEQDACGFLRYELGIVELVILQLDRDANDIGQEESYPLSSCNPPDLLRVRRDAMLRCRQARLDQACTWLRHKPLQQPL